MIYVGIAALVFVLDWYLKEPSGKESERGLRYGKWRMTIYCLGNCTIADWLFTSCRRTPGQFCGEALRPPRASVCIFFTFEKRRECAAEAGLCPGGGRRSE